MQTISDFAPDNLVTASGTGIVVQYIYSMKALIKSLALLLSILVIFPLLAHSQNSINAKQKKFILEPIDSVITRGYKDLLKDSIGLYAFNFRLEIIKKGEKTQLIRIDANDSLAYKLFPSYKRFYSINYSSLIGNRRKITLVIPVLVPNISATAEKRYKSENGSPLIDMNAAVNAAIALNSIADYNNIKDVKTHLHDQIYRSKKNKIESPLNADKVFLPPYLVQILNIK